MGTAIVRHGCLQEFIGEVNMLLTLSHPNVVKCFGACVESKFLALVTDYWPRGCLYAVLHDPTVRMRCSHRFGSDAVGLRVHWRRTPSPTTVADAAPPWLAHKSAHPFR